MAGAYSAAPTRSRITRTRSRASPGRLEAAKRASSRPVPRWTPCTPNATWDFRHLRTTTTYDQLGRVTVQREKGFGRKGTWSTAHETQQTDDLERYTQNTYVELKSDEPVDYDTAYTPAYLVDRLSTTARYGVTASGDVLLSKERTFYDGNAYQGLGHPDATSSIGVTKGNLSCKLVLAFESGDVASIYPSGSGASTALSARGNTLTDTDEYIQAERYQYDSNGMITGAKDPNGNESTFAYDTTYGLFPVTFTDAAGHPTELERGELQFQVATVTDANDNETEFAYDPSGLPKWKAVKGKLVSGAWQGDPDDRSDRAVHLRLHHHPDPDRREDPPGPPRRHLRRHPLHRRPRPHHPGAPHRGAGSGHADHRPLAGDRLADLQPQGSGGPKAYQPTFATTDAYSAGSTSTRRRRDDLRPRSAAPCASTYPDGTYETTTYHPWVQQFADRNDNAGAITSSDERYGAFLDRFGSHVDTPTRTYPRRLRSRDRRLRRQRHPRRRRAGLPGHHLRDRLGLLHRHHLRPRPEAAAEAQLLRDDPGRRLHRRPERQQHPVPRHRRSARHGRSRHLQR